MNVSSVSSIFQNHKGLYSSSCCCFCGNRYKNHPTNFNFSRNFISAAAANLEKTSPTTRTSIRIRRRRINHLRKKLQVTLENPNPPNIVLKNPVLVNQLETESSLSSAGSVLPVVNQDHHHHHHQILANLPPNLIQQHRHISLWAGISSCAFLLFIAFTFYTKTTRKKQIAITSFDKEMLTRKLKSRITKHQNMILPQHAKIQQISTMATQTDIQITNVPQPDFSLSNTGNSHVSIPENHKKSNLLEVENKPAPAPTQGAGRIITNVKEARQYLDNKKPNPFDISANDTPTSNLQQNVENAHVNAKAGEELKRANRDKWMEDNFHEFQPVVDKIRAGFSSNYNLAKQKVKEDVDDIVSDLKMLQRDETETELEWMKDEKLTEIVFQVRENELMGRDPFYLMDHQDKALFFKGLEKKVEKENEKLRLLHEYLHSNIENLDYGADGISLYDPPEKMIPRWKGPPPATTMSQESLDDYLHQRKSLFAETLGNSDLIKSDPKGSKTVIEGSDGSVKPGKKSGKEFWHHTKKWSRGFIDSYNAENDPETKAVMKDIGKDLDRWITEKEIQATADIMDKIPDKGKKFIAEKISKLKTEMELFGPQAVVSKYSEYGEEEEIDYYWWLDLPFLLCIELYIEGDEEERIGFYSLEMASDLELDPKPHHIIAFEDAGDCKNYCYIIQAHMEMLGNGDAFVVPQLPKDTYREAKTNGFNVTVIRKGELKLDVDQTLEEVEEKVVEIGSKMYHDKIMKGRNVNVDSVMKGVFGVNKRSRSKKKLKKPTK